ncbi:histone deacetylase family protein [Herbidospora sp. NEAU-GS84]|uniref:Histone deacetylase family protein n=1 Tax=Herbidospora solisilvae TaxID=2696284 RepID=A0A7C9N4L5_9ACTN|nr:histone deacetylase family protein [Herbidospora solisilvae]NAS24334.1 histone deacetylase family protein [Herbidospora solisilvae]
MIGVWSPATLRHDPSAEIWIGLRTPGTEVAERVHRIREAVAAEWVPAEEAPWSALTSVHSEGLLRHLRDVYGEWVAAGYPQDRVVPYVFPTEAMLGGMPGRLPAAVHGRAGRYAYDTMTLVGPGTWEAALTAAGAAWTAARRVSSEGLVYALCRPPGHHATRDGYGGSCYLNNAAVAATTLLAEGCAKVAVIDVDAHHGNGTQAIFWDRDDVFYGSVHVDPGAGWFPHYVGFADETGGGTTLNVPVAPESGDAVWLAGVTRLCEAAQAFGAEALVVSLGVDAAADDPESPLRVTREGYFETGRLLGGLGLPTVAVQEGGYHLETLGPLVAATLCGIQSPS